MQLRCGSRRGLWPPDGTRRGSAPAALPEAPFPPPERFPVSFTRRGCPAAHLKFRLSKTRGKSPFEHSGRAGEAYIRGNGACNKAAPLLGLCSPRGRSRRGTAVGSPPPPLPQKAAAGSLQQPYGIAPEGLSGFCFFQTASRVCVGGGGVETPPARVLGPGQPEGSEVLSGYKAGFQFCLDWMRKGGGGELCF